VSASGGRPVVLLPPSKGKAAGGDGPAFRSVLRRRGPLAAPRREVAAAVVVAAQELDDAALARLAGVGSGKVDEAREELAGLLDAPTLPAHRRYTGVVHGNAGLAALDPSAAEVDVRIVSGLLGLVALDEPVPPYRVEVAASAPGLGGLATYWRDHLGAHLAEVTDGVRVWDLLPGEHRRALPAHVLAGTDRVEVRFERPDGRAANAARTKVAKGLVTAWLLAHPRARPGDLARRVRLGEGWSVRTDAGAVVAVSTH
jgi:cytoplasmic iron level regulating protein YaaA (DUF328/UPF0246 family)